MGKIVPYFVLLLALILTTLNSHAETKQSLKLAGTHWCPYSCDYAPFPGFVTQYITAILEKQNISVSVDVMPWGQARAKVLSGEYDGLITGTPDEAPGLLFTEQATDIYHSCFYTDKESAWRYNGLDSLSQQRLGIIKNYAYGEPLDSWIDNPEQQSNLYASEGKNPLRKLINQLNRGEIDVFIQDRYVLSHFLYRTKEDSSPLIEAGCLSESPFYFALNPNAENAQAIIDYLNQNITSDKNRQLKHYFKLRYGLEKYF